MIMIGAASEKMIYLLSEAIESAANDPKIKKNYREAIEHRKLFDLFDLVSLTFDTLIKKNLPYSVHEGSNQYLASLFDAIRTQRNNAVHPITIKLSVDQLRLLLLCFPHVCKKAYNYIDWLGHNRF
jgi:hypothetical protein